MNGLEKITQRIEQDAQAEAGQVLADARARADAIAAEWAEKARKEREDILERGRKNAGERAERLASVAQLEGRKQILAAKQEMGAGGAAGPPRGGVRRAAGRPVRQGGRHRP